MRFPSPPLSIPLVVKSPFGSRKDPITGEPGGFHNGIDLRAPEGSDVLSPDAGVVSRVFRGDEGGLQMLVELDSGFRVGFAHLSSTQASPGQRVAAGDVIALSGHSGEVTGPHLHFTVKPTAGRDNVDPAPFLFGGGGGGGAAKAGLAGLALYAVYKALT